MSAEGEKVMKSLLEIQNVLLRDNVNAYGGTRAQMLSDFREKFNYSFNDRLSLDDILYSNKYLSACYRLGEGAVNGWYEFNPERYSKLEVFVRSFYIPYNSFDINLSHDEVVDCGTSYFLGYSNALKKLIDSGKCK